jgi:hypothetical protein
MQSYNIVKFPGMQNWKVMQNLQQGLFLREWRADAKYKLEIYVDRWYFL